jgi:hypothetical protein
MSLSAHIFAIVGSVIVLLGIIEMLRRRQLSEKYAVLWLVVGVLILVLTVFPGLLTWFSQVIGIQVPTNLMFFVAIVFLVGVSIHQSWELSRLEDETRRLAEDVAILRLEIDEKLKKKADS